MIPNHMRISDEKVAEHEQGVTNLVILADMLIQQADAIIRLTAQLTDQAERLDVAKYEEEEQPKRRPL